MHAVLATPIAEQARAVIEARLRLSLRPGLTLAEFRPLSIAMVLLDLEERFGILLDPDEVAAFDDMIALVEIRVRARGSLPKPDRPCNLIDLAAFRGERARRARDCYEIPPPPNEAKGAAVTPSEEAKAAAPPLQYADLQRVGRIYGWIALIASVIGGVSGLIYLVALPG